MKMQYLEKGVFKTFSVTIFSVNEGVDNKGVKVLKRGIAL